MHKTYKLISCVLLLFFLLSAVLVFPVRGCKDIIAVGDATAGDYNLLLKVRDPSRPGLQVLCIVPEGYEYTYHHPWNGESWDFVVEHKYIGVATKDDIIPDIVKPGMALSDAGIAFGDADTGSNWINPTRHAWDDFDWIRYACEQADNENEAVNLFTVDVVDELHATGVSENLFVVGPREGFVIEADAVRYDVKEVDGVAVMSNYPKELWRTHVHKKRPIAPYFDVEKEQYVRKGRTLRLNSLYGVKIVDVGNDSILARQIPFVKILNGRIMIMGEPVKIMLDERETVGDFSVKLMDISGKRANLQLKYVYHAWEDKMMDFIQPKYGDITVKDMMNWSRLHTEDLDGLRPMCEHRFPYEAVAIYKIPQENYETLSMGWFAPNHACSSIFVPFHICDNDIFDPYENGEAAELSLELLDSYGNDTLIPVLIQMEEIFLFETLVAEEIAKDLITKDLDVSDFFTVVDMGMQRQAWQTLQILSEVSKISDLKNRQDILDVVCNMWSRNYSGSLGKMREAVQELRGVSGSRVIIEQVWSMVFDICQSRIDAARVLGRQINTTEEEYNNGRELIIQGDYDQGFDRIEKVYSYVDMLFKGESLTLFTTENDENGNIEIPLDTGYIVVVFFVIVIFVSLFKKRYESG